MIVSLVRIVLAFDQIEVPMMPSCEHWDYLNEGYEWVIDLDIEAYFDTVNHDKLISILREHVNDSTTLHLIRKFLQAGIMENGLVKASTIGMPQGGPLSPILSNIYLDKFDKELEARGTMLCEILRTIVISSLKSRDGSNRVMSQSHHG